MVLSNDSDRDRDLRGTSSIVVLAPTIQREVTRIESCFNLCDLRHEPKLNCLDFQRLET